MQRVGQRPLISRTPGWVWRSHAKALGLSVGRLGIAPHFGLNTHPIIPHYSAILANLASPELGYDRIVLYTLISYLFALEIFSLRVLDDLQCRHMVSLNTVLQSDHYIVKLYNKS